MSDRLAALSWYESLLHSHMLQVFDSTAVTFWAGCGAIRHSAVAAGGDLGEGHTLRSIEDSELGTRLCRAGYHIQLKEWTLADLHCSDVCHRTLPWTRLILRQGRIPGNLSLSVGGGSSAISACLTVLVLALGFAWPPLWSVLVPLVALLLALDAGLYGFSVPRCGWFASREVLMHWFHYSQSGPVFASATSALVVPTSTLDLSDLSRVLRELRLALERAGRLVGTLDDHQNILDPLLRLIARLGWAPYCIGHSCAVEQLRAEPEDAGLAGQDVTAILLNLPLAGAGAKSVASRLGWVLMSALAQRLLRAAQHLEEARWRYFTGSFVAAEPGRRAPHFNGHRVERQPLCS